MVIWLLIVSIMMVAISGCPGLLLSRRGVAGQRIAAVLNVMSSRLGIAGLVLHFARPEISHQISVPWTLPIGRVDMALDDLSVIFLIPIFLISALGAVYGLSYWSQREHAGNGRKLRLCWGLLTAGMALVVLARDGVLFLMAWEIMALAAFFLVATEGANREAREGASVHPWFFRSMAFDAGNGLSAHGDRTVYLGRGRVRSQSRYHAVTRVASWCARECPKPCFRRNVGRAPEDRCVRARADRGAGPGPAGVVGRDVAGRRRTIGGSGDILCGGAARPE